MPRSGYVSSFIALQYALCVLVEFVCADGHRIKCRMEMIDWQSKTMIWC
jgi:hypothetical protein